MYPQWEMRNKCMPSRKICTWLCRAFLLFWLYRNVLVHLCDPYARILQGTSLTHGRTTYNRHHKSPTFEYVLWNVLVRHCVSVTHRRLNIVENSFDCGKFAISMRIGSCYWLYNQLSIYIWISTKTDHEEIRQLKCHISWCSFDLA